MKAMATQSIPKGYKLVPDSESGQSDVPEGRARAAAMTSFLARGGGLSRGRKVYRSGPLKNMTQAQAEQHFSKLWSKASPALKDHYASMSNEDSILAPSEKASRVGTPAPKPNLGVQGNRMRAYEDQKISRIRHYQGDAGVEAYQKRTAATPAFDKDRNGVPDMIQRPTGDERETQSQRASHGSEENGEYGTVGTPEQQAKVAKMVSEGSNFATADTGDGGMKSAVAMSDGRPMRDMFDLTNYTGKPVSAPVEKTPVESAIDSTLDAGSRFLDRTSTAVKSFVSAPFTPPSERIVGKESDAARIALDAKRAADAKAAQDRLTAENTAKLRRERGLPEATTNAPAQKPAAQPVVTSAPVKNAVARVQSTTPDMEPAPTGKSLVPRGTTVADGKTSRRVNPLTGLPFGHMPGDSLPSGADATMKGRAMDSTVRQDFGSAPTATTRDIAGAQRMMESDGVIPRTVTTPAPMPRGPASQPSPTGSALDNPNNAFSKEAYARTAAAEAKGVKRQEELSRAVNVDDPRKFFTGRVLPLDQLVKRQKTILPGSTRPQFAGR